MSIKILILLFSILLLFSCTKKNNELIISDIENEESVIAIYAEAITALMNGGAFRDGKKFREVESLLPQTEWAAKASLMSAYSDYSRNSYTESVFGLERYIKNYPADKNVSYAHYLIAICYYEQILDEKKDLAPLLKAQDKFNFIILTYPETDYATDAMFKIDLIINQLAAKEMSIARYYMKVEKWIPALKRLKSVQKNFDKTIFIEEALHRIVEVYYKIGLVEEAKAAASILGYNYGSGEWYSKSYKVFNKEYEEMKIDKKKEMSFLRKKIKELLK